MVALFRPRRPSRSRTIAVAVLIVLFLLFLSSNAIARLYTDYLWFDHLGFSQVWSSIIATKLVLALGFSALFALIVWINLTVATRVAPQVRSFGPEDDLIERYHSLVGTNGGRLRIALSVIFGLLGGTNTVNQWNSWILFRHSKPFGYTDPVFGKDASFYVFRLPFWNFLVNWFFAVLIFTVVFTAVAHYLHGGIRATVATSKVAPGAKNHLAVLFALLASIRALMYWLDRFDLVNASGGVVDGALATDLNVRLPALNLLVLVSLCCAVLFLASIWRSGWLLPIIAVTLWLVVTIVVSGIFPAVYERVRIQPERTTRQAEHVQHNIEATMFAYGLDDEHLTVEDFDYTAEFTPETLAANTDIFDSVMLLDPALAVEPFTKTQSDRSFYHFSDRLDVDRYATGDSTTPVVISTRELNPNALENEWEVQHIVYTHGYGVVAAAANSIADGGSPDFVVEGMGPGLRSDPALDLVLDQPQVYVGDGFRGYAIVGAKRDEVDYEASTTGTTRYEGAAGIPVDSFVRKAAFATRFSDFDLLISDFLTSDSEIIFNRDAASRAQEVAPFLVFDPSEIYPIVDEGRIKWVLDGYTGTNEFPYAQKTSSNDGQFNYIRNAVKAVIDSYDGDVKIYVVDPDDPIIAAYQEAFPGLMSPAREIPPSIAAHFRYPRRMFEYQSDIYATYQVADPVKLIQKGQIWSVSTQPTIQSSDSTASQVISMIPQYMLTRLPGRDETEFVLQRSFVPGVKDGASDNARPELMGMMYARSDPGKYGELIVYRLSATEKIPAPDLVDSNINKDAIISKQVTLLSQSGSSVKFGNMVTTLVDGAIVFVRPLYVEASGENGVPVLSRVIAVSGSRIAIAETLEEALSSIATGRPAQITTDDGTEEPVVVPPVSEDLEDLSVADLLTRATELLDAADRIEKSGDASEAAELRAQAQEALTRLEQVLGIESSPSSSTDSGDA